MTDLSTAITSMTGNQLLVAGVGTALTAHFVSKARGIYEAIKGTVRGQIIQTLTVKQSPNRIRDLCGLLAMHRVHVSGRSYSMFGGESGLSIGYGHGFAWWRGTLVVYDLSLDNQQGSYHGMTEALNLTFYTRRKGVVSDFVAEAVETFKPASDTIAVNHRTGGCWSTVLRKKRPMDTVFANGDTKATIIGKLRWFLDNEAWYVARGINYKLVILLYGQPGCGKTSLIQAIASHAGRNLYCMDNLYAIDACMQRFENGILAIEDIDTLANLRRPEDVRPAITLNGIPIEPQQRTDPFDSKAPQDALHGLLNTLDGLGTPHGLVTIITTNHLGALDPALIRPCRVDLLLEVEPLDHAAFSDMFASYYDGATPTIGAEGWRPMTGAALQEIFMTNPVAADAERAILTRPGRRQGAALMMAAE